MNQGLCDAAKDELALAEELRLPFQWPKENNAAMSEAQFTSDVLELLIVPELPLSVQHIMAQACRVLRSVCHFVADGAPEAQELWR